MRKRSKKDFFKAIFGVFCVMIGLVVGVATTLVPESVYADPDNGETVNVEEKPEGENNDENTNENSNTNNDENTGNTDGTTENNENNNDGDQEKKPAKNEEINGDACKTSLGEIGWLVCPTTGKIAEAVDWLYDKIEGILAIDPVSMDDNAPVYVVWKYCLSIANIVFVIFLLVVVFSQITGVGITNYGIKKVLPKLIVTAVLVNLSFLICVVAVDLSNIIGNGLRGAFQAVGEAMVASGATDGVMGETISYSGLYFSLAGGSLLAVAGGIIAFETGAIWMLIPVVLGAIVAVVSGLITIALRQAVVMLLIMIAPLAIVAYILPNTEKWFTKWKDLLIKMLVFYPMFSLLFGASNLAGFAIITSATDAFGVLLGIAVQIFPLFFSWKLMQMSGTVLGTINAKMQGIAAKPLAASRSLAESQREYSKQKHLASARPITPSLRLMQAMSNKNIAREAESEERAALIKERGLAYRAKQKYKRQNLEKGILSKKGEEAYERQALVMEHQRTSLRDKNNFNKGFEYLVIEKDVRRKARIRSLDNANVDASDKLKVEQARGERIEYDNAKGFHDRMEAAVNVHMDDVNGYKINSDGKREPKKDYKFHFADEKSVKEARERYTAMSKIMEGNGGDVQYAAATATHSYDTQKKLVETKMQKYFELTAPTKDLERRLDEMTKSNELRNEVASKNIDFILPGLRILNQRGDTNLVQDQINNLIDKKIGGGIQLGTHASQSLASFLMFEVKDSDPFMRRFGKYINLETANAFNENKRKVMDITYDEYLLGYHDGEDGGRMYAKKSMTQLMEGTSLDNVERTAFDNLNDNLKKAYGFGKDKNWDVDGYLKRLDETKTAIEPAFLSANLKWPSGSEAINSGMKFWMGYELKQKKDGQDRVILGDDGKPVYGWVPVWGDSEKEKNGFIGVEKKVRDHYRKQTRSFFADQTTGQILNIRTDNREPSIEHLMGMYFSECSEEEGEKRRNEYEDAKREIESRYSNEDEETAKKNRKEDLANLRRDIAGRQIRKILDETGKLEQIYAVRRSGTANNAKDWWRSMLGLDDKEGMRRYLAEKDRQNRQKAQQQPHSGNSAGDTTNGTHSPYNDHVFQTHLMAELDNIFDMTGSNVDADDDFYNQSYDKIVSTFGNNEIARAYEEYRRNHRFADRSELKDKLDELLGDFFLDNE